MQVKTGFYVGIKLYPDFVSKLRSLFFQEVVEKTFAFFGVVKYSSSCLKMNTNPYGMQSYLQRNAAAETLS